MVIQKVIQKGRFKVRAYMHTSTIATPNLSIEQRRIEILKICLVWILKEVGLRICAKFRNNLTKDEGVIVKKANVLPNCLDRRTDRPSHTGWSKII